MPSIKAALVTRILHSKGTALSMVLLSLAGFIVSYCSGSVMSITGDKGTVFPSANEWFSAGLPDFAAAIASFGLSLFLMVSVCKIFNVLRSLTWLHVAFFSLMQAATPGLAVQFYTGSMLLPVVLVGILLLLGTYREPRATRQIFLIFFLLSLAATTQYCYAVYAIVFFMGCAQMQIFNGRTITAALLGIISPWWILLGFGLISPADIHLPSFTSIFSAIGSGSTLLLLIAVGISAFIMVLALILNVFRTIAYNARARAINGVFTVLSLVTLVACAADYRNLISYIPLLNFCAALQAAHYFATHRAEKSCIAILLVMAAYIALYICQRVI